MVKSSEMQDIDRPQNEGHQVRADLDRNLDSPLTAPLDSTWDSTSDSTWDSTLDSPLDPIASILPSISGKSHPSAITERNFLIFWIGQIFSILGSWVVNFTISWWIVSVYPDPEIISIYSALTYLPFIIVTPFAGVWVDRWNKKKTIVIVDSIIAVSTLGYILTLQFNYIHLWLIILLGAINTSCAAFQQPAISAMVPTMIRPENLTRVNGLKTFSGGGVRLLGPVITGMLLQFFPIHQLLWIDIITYAIATSALFLIKLPTMDKREVEDKGRGFTGEIQQFFCEFREGFQAIRNTPIVKFLIVLTLIANFLHTPYSILYTLFIQSVHGANESNYAFLSLMNQIGILLGSFLMTLKIQWKNRPIWIVVGNICMGIFTMVVLMAPEGSFWLMGIFIALGGINMGILLALYYGILQEKLSPSLQGRIYAFDAFLSVCIMPIAMLISGPLAQILGIVPFLLICEIGSIVFSGYMLGKAWKKRNIFEN